MTTSYSHRYWPLALLLIGALPGLTAHYWYRIGLLASAEIGLIRTLGLLGVIALGMSLVALVVAAVLVATPKLHGPVPARVGRSLLFVAIAGNLVSVGLALHYWSPMLAPAPIKLAALVGLLVVAIAFARYRATDQIFILRCLAALGGIALAVPLLASPWIVHAALTHSSQLKGAVAPPQAPVLRADRPKRIVLLTFDALSAERTSLHNRSLHNTPNLRALADESTWFTRTRSAGSGTLVSLAATLTGLSPSTVQPQLQAKLGYIPFGAVTGIGGFLKSAGYESLYATMFVHPSTFGIADEFDRGHYNSRRFFSTEFHSRSFLPFQETWAFTKDQLLGIKQPLADGAFVQPALQAVPRTFAQATQLLKEADSPTFLWMHIGAPHLPYARLPGLKAGSKPTRVVTVDEAAAVTKSGDAKKAAEIQSVYEDYVAYVDQELGRFLAALKRDPAWKDTLLIVTSDHGESHRPGHIGHGGGPITLEQVAIPLLIHEPGQTKPVRVDDFVSQIDLLPTIAARVYREAPPGLPGAPLLGAPVPVGRTLFTFGWMSKKEGHGSYPKSIAVYHDRYSYIVDFSGTDGKLYDVVADPGETQDVSARHPEVAEKLRQAALAESRKF